MTVPIVGAALALKGPRLRGDDGANRSLSILSQTTCKLMPQ